jgi:hypothetical protein
MLFKTSFYFYKYVRKIYVFILRKYINNLSQFLAQKKFSANNINSFSFLPGGAISLSVTIGIVFTLSPFLSVTVKILLIFYPCGT